MPTKTKLDKMLQSHGKTETFKPTTLEQILGDTGTHRYGTMNIKEYEKKLNIMSKSDLQAHATKVGLIPIDDRERMMKRLIHEFNLHVSQYRHPSQSRTTSQTPSPEIQSILAKGR